MRRVPYPTTVFAHPLVWVGPCLLFACIASQIWANSPQTDPTGTSHTPPQILREGTKIELRSCECRAAGERLMVEFKEEKRMLVALENLAAQRILKAVVDDPQDSAWTVTGQLTEFRDQNFILLQRVIRTPKHHPTR